MEIPKSNGTNIQVSLPMNITQEQYIFTDRFKAFDPNMCSAIEYSPPSSVTNTQQTTAVIAPFQAIGSNYNELSGQSADISLVPVTETSNNCITYSNVIFMPSISNDGNKLNQIGETVELVKHDTNLSGVELNDSQSYKYIVSTDPHLVNTFIPSNGINNATTVLNSTESFIEQQPSQIITNVSQINENDLMINETDQIQQHLSNGESIDQNQIAVQMQTANDQAILMQDENGLLYRQVQNILINGTSMCPNELLPILSAPVDLADPDYVEQSISRIQSTFNQRDNMLNDIPFQIPINFVANAESSEVNSKSIDSNLDMQQVEFIFSNYRNNNESQIVNSSQYETEANLSINGNYQSHPSIQLEPPNQQRNLLESTMSTLLAAVNDITARDEQFKQYLNTSKSSPDDSLEYYSTERVDNLTPTIYSNATEKTTDCTKGLPKPMTLETISNEIFRNNHCDSPTDEYVDINDMEFIKKNNDEGQQTKNILIKRPRRKKTAKQKEDALLIADKFVPSRAFATLPTSYLYFETVNDVSTSRSKHMVFAKREIPLEMKFGPFVGDTKMLNKQEIKKYRESESKYPCLFLSQNSILDVSNENTSNWMRFVRLASKYSEQNLFLCINNSQLYFKCCKTIYTKQELRVGYSKEYAQKYHFEQLLPEKPTEYLCRKCDERVELTENDHKSKDTKKCSIQSVPRTTPTKATDSISPNKSKDRLNTGAIRMRKLALSKNSRPSGPTVRYACCYCSKVFSKFFSYKKHTNAVHSVDIEHKRIKVDAQHKRLTVEDSIMKMGSVKENQQVNDISKQLFVCQVCQQHFETHEKLEKHQLSKCSHKVSSTQCNICFKNLQTPSALTMHLKTHESTDGICKCPFCSEQYQSTIIFREHVKSHMIDGTYKCPHCPKEFPKYSSIRKHIRINHSDVRFVCHECGKDFKSKYKLKEHSLSHSDVREFACDDCDKQFKRKDKLREHILRIHVKAESPKKVKKRIKNQSLEPIPTTNSTECHDNDADDDADADADDDDNDDDDDDGDDDEYSTEEKDRPVYSDSKSIQSDDELLPEKDSKESPPPSTKPKFKPKVPPTDYERFIYKCQYCMLGFKRRGMLVNHMAKRHPEISITSIHELNLPILKTERCFYCQYCEKSYKSSSKRKAHILKYHPGQQLPMRHKNDEYENSIESNPSFSLNVGSVTTLVHQCSWCYKQYASRSRLLQHKRKDHSKEIEASYQHNQSDYFKELNMIMDSHEGHFQQSQLPINQSVDEYTIKINELHENESHSMHRFHHIEYEPENRLLELSSAALETFRDDYSFLSDSDVHTENINHRNMDGSRVDVNFKMVGDEFGQENSNCDLNTLPQLFEEIDCMSLKPSQFTPNTSTQIDGSIGKLNFHK